MGLLSKEELLAKTEEYVEVFKIDLPGRIQGEIRIRPIRDTKEMEAISTQVTKILTGRPFLPANSKIKSYSEADINNGVYLAACIVDPQFTVDEALQLMETLGPVARMIMVRIFKISGLSPDAMDEAEEKLAKDGFPADDVSSLLGVFTPASERSQSEPSGSSRNLRLSQDKK